MKCPCCKYEPGSEDIFGDSFKTIYCEVLNQSLCITTEYDNEPARKCPECGILFIPKRTF